jgi:putative DNA methylase
MKRAIEDGFPIVEINRLVVPERNGFKPIYRMHKSFAPRASCVFRAILLAALKPAGTNIISEFYRDHTNDPDTNGKVVLDPFMGGGTTVVEATRLGISPIGIELNPVPWFVVKTALAPASLRDLNDAFARLEKRIVSWSGKSVAKTLSHLYDTQPPFLLIESNSSSAPSRTIHTYWVKSAVCTDQNCKKLVPLFTDYVVAKKEPSIRYHADCTCPKCARKFDWDVEPAALIADPRLMFHSSTYSAGTGRTTARWTYAHPTGGLFVCQGEPAGGQGQCRWGTLGKGQVCCPHCYEIVTPRLAAPKTKRKKIPIAVLHCPKTEEVFQWRGELASDTQVTSPAGNTFLPLKGNVPDDGGFICPHCGNPDAVINSIRTLPKDQRLAMHVYAIQAYAPDADLRDDHEAESRDDLFADNETVEANSALPPSSNLIWKNKGKFFARYTPKDLASYQEAVKIWCDHNQNLPWPRSEIPKGEKTKSGCHSHHYWYWADMFNERQLLALSTLLRGIQEEPDDTCRELLLLAFSGAVERNNLFCRYFNDRNTIQGNFDRHDYAPKLDPAENCVWGSAEIRGTFQNMLGRVREGLAFRTSVYDRDLDRLGEADSLIFSKETISLGTAEILNGDSREIIPTISKRADAVITDPPYAGNVNYSELYDFFYVWLRLALKDRYDAFKPEYTPKIPEIIENKTRGLSNEDFRDGLRNVFERCREKVKDDGLLAFTYHHSGDQQWVDLCDAVCLAGFVIEAVYPVHAEKESSLNLRSTEGISYDLIHVCRKRPESEASARRSWAGLRQVVRQRARDEIARIEAGRYGSRPLSPADVRIVLIGKCLEVYSRHYGSVTTSDDGVSQRLLPMHEALADIGEMVEQMISKESPLPAELENADVISRIWLRALCNARELSIDSIRKLTQGILELSDLTKYFPPLVRKGRLKGGRTYEVLTPLERASALREMLRGATATSEQLTLLDSVDNTPVVIGPKMVDVLHLLAANAEQGERLDNLVERFRGQREQIRAALEYLKQRDPNRWANVCDKLLPFYSDLFAQAIVANAGK